MFIALSKFVPPPAETLSTSVKILLAPVSLILTLIRFDDAHCINPKLAPEVKSVFETIFLITFLAASKSVPPAPP